jgi:hypothetical protein
MTVIVMNLIQQQLQKCAWRARHCATGANGVHPGAHRARCAPTLGLLSATC